MMSQIIIPVLQTNYLSFYESRFFKLSFEKNIYIQAVPIYQEALKSAL